MGRKGQEVPVLRCLKASPDGRQLVAGDRKGNLRVFDVAGLKEVAVLEVGPAPRDKACNKGQPSMRRERRGGEGAVFAFAHTY